MRQIIREEQQKQICLKQAQVQECDMMQAYHNLRYD
jgi:hypothetical protein